MSRDDVVTEMWTARLYGYTQITKCKACGRRYMTWKYFGGDAAALAERRRQFPRTEAWAGWGNNGGMCPSCLKLQPGWNDDASLLADWKEGDYFVYLDD